MPVAREKPAEAGKPVVIASTLELVVSAGEAIVADTTTDVCAVPELTTVCTVPSEPETAEGCARLEPADGRIQRESYRSARASTAA